MWNRRPPSISLVRPLIAIETCVDGWWSVCSCDCWRLPCLQYLEARASAFMFCRMASVSSGVASSWCPCLDPLFLEIFQSLDLRSVIVCKSRRYCLSPTCTGIYVAGTRSLQWCPMAGAAPRNHRASSHRVEWRRSKGPSKGPASSNRTVPLELMVHPKVPKLPLRPPSEAMSILQFNRNSCHTTTPGTTWRW